MYRFGQSELISTGSTFLDGVLGFGIALVLLPGASGTWVGILVASVLLALSGIVIDAGMRSIPDSESQEAQDSPVDVALLWFVATMIWLVAAVPACAFVAPEYELRGFTTNLGAWLIVMSVGWLTGWARRLR